MDLMIAGMIGFLLCAFGARFLSERALRLLSDQEKVSLVNAFAGMRTYGLLWAVGLLVVMFFLPRAFPADPRKGLYIGLVLAIAFVVARQVITARKIKALQVDPAYRKKIGVAQLLGSLGFAILIVCVVWGTLHR